MGCGQSGERDVDGDPQPKKKGLDSFLCKKRPKNLIIFVLGGPGSGKGTQCEKIVKDYGFVHLSVGDLLRNEVNNDSDLGKQAKTCMAEGRLVPVETALELLKNAMEKSTNKKFLIDGFPRSVDQAKAFEDKICSPNMVLYLECSPEVMEKRLLERGATSGRIDDNIETIKKRFKTFEEETVPVTKYYENSGKGVLVKDLSPSQDKIRQREVRPKRIKDEGRPSEGQRTSSEGQGQDAFRQRQRAKEKFIKVSFITLELVPVKVASQSSLLQSEATTLAYLDSMNLIRINVHKL